MIFHNSSASLWEHQLIGPIEFIKEYLEDPHVSDLLIQGMEAAFIEKNGTLVPICPPFPSEEKLYEAIERFILPIGKQIDAAKPYLDGRLKDGSRFHLILPPIAVYGPYLSIRKFSSKKIGLDAFAPIELVKWLQEQVAMKKNILISGGTGTGKTTLLAALLDEVPVSERVVVLEETRELPLRKNNLVFLEGRSCSPEGLGGVSLRALLRNSLRMRPDRIVVGECRGEEAFDLIQALSTGHAGSLATIHAKSPLQALGRLEALTTLSHPTLTLEGIRRWVVGAIEFVVQLARGPEGRRISSVIQVVGIQGESYIHTPIYDATDPILKIPRF